jgi:hypothetical protein
MLPTISSNLNLFYEEEVKLDLLPCGTGILLKPLASLLIGGTLRNMCNCTPISIMGMLEFDEWSKVRHLMTVIKTGVFDPTKISIVCAPPSHQKEVALHLFGPPSNKKEVDLNFFDGDFRYKL